MTSTIPDGLTTNVCFGLMSRVNHCSNVCFLAYDSSKSCSPCLQQKDSCYEKSERMSQQKLTISLRTECTSHLFTFCWPKQVIRSRQISILCSVTEVMPRSLIDVKTRRWLSMGKSLPTWQLSLEHMWKVRCRNTPIISQRSCKERQEVKTEKTTLSYQGSWSWVLSAVAERRETLLPKTRWKERTDFQKLSFACHGACHCTHTRAFIHIHLHSHTPSPPPPHAKRRRK